MFCVAQPTLLYTPIELNCYTEKHRIKYSIVYINTTDLNSLSLLILYETKHKLKCYH